MPIIDNIQIKQLDMELFGGCNYACAMCPQSTGREKEFLKSLPYNIFTKIIDDARQYDLRVVSLHGSGEPTLHKKMPQCIEYVKNGGEQCYSFTNGYTLNKFLARNIISSGLDLLRLSAVGYDEESYSKWMEKGAFNIVRENARKFVELNEKMNGNTELHFYHLITDNNNIEKELELYKKNWVDYIGGGKHEIWLMHNWAGTYDETPYHREQLSLNKEKRTCGRPWAPILQVRAGGLNKHHGAVVACCMVLGRDSEAVLGHLDDQTIEEVIKGTPYLKLQLAHNNKQFDIISYCKDCDQLYDIPESLIWSNIPGREYGKSKMLDMDIRKEFMKE